jgi:hypothetical protein
MSAFRLRPSSAPVWVYCAGSVQAQENYPDNESDAARDGTASHWVCESVLKSYQSESVTTCAEYVGKTAPNGVMISDEMADGADLYVKHVLSLCQANGLLSAMRVEETVAIERVHADNGGTPDVVIYDEKNGVIHVIDYKFGYGVVEAVENWQLIDYSIGIVDSLAGNMPGLVDQLLTINMTVVQPRAWHDEGPIRSWSITGDQLRGYANRLRSKAEIAVMDDPTTVAGKHCEYCTARADCTTLKNADYRARDYVESLQLRQIPADDMSTELEHIDRAFDLIKARRDALTDQAMERIRGGELIPGRALGNGQGRYKWSKPDDEVFALGDLLNINLRKKPQPVTPTQAKKLNVDETVINHYIEFAAGKTRLTTVSGDKVALIFNKT